MLLDKAAINILKVCMGLKKNETFLVVYDKNKIGIANVLLKKAIRLCKKADKIVIPVGEYNGQEPPKKVTKKIKEYDVAVLLTTKSLSHTNARRNASKKGVRIASMPGATLPMIKRTLDVDYNKIESMNKKIYNLFKSKKKVWLLTERGTDVLFYINKSPFNDNGLYHKKGEFGNLPAGEVGFAPVELKSKGIIVIDKTMAGIGKLKNVIELRVNKGFVKKIEGKDDAKKLVKLLKKFKNKNVYNIAEFSIGTNYKAKITGVPLEDEKVYGTVHVAIGDNTSYPGGKTKAPIHLDGIISKPTVLVDNRKIMEKGRLLI